MEDKTIRTHHASESEELEKIDLFALIADMWKGIRAFWWLPFLLALVVGIWKYATCDRSYTPYYQTSATVYVQMAGSDDDGTSSYKNSISAKQMQTFFPYLMQNGVLTDAIQTELGTDSLPGSISVDISPATNLLTFTASGQDPEKIHELLTATIQVFPDTLSYIVGPTHFTVFKDMGVPKNPANQPPSQLLYIKTALKSMVVVFGAAVLLLALYGLGIRTFSSMEEVKQYLNASYLGSLPSVRFKKRSNRQKNQLTLDNPQIPYGFEESMRTVRTRFEREMEQAGSRIAMITSTIPGEGKTTLAVNLALSLAQNGSKVLLIDGDMRNPSVERTLQLEKQSGLYEVLSGTAKLETVIHKLPETGLYVLTAGSVSRRSADLLSSRQMEKLLEQVRAYADYILVDTPPIMVLGDSMALGRYADTCVYVIRRGRARRHLVLDGFSQIAEHGCPILGTVLNDDVSGSTGYGGRYSRYGKYGSYGRYGRYGKYGYGETKGK